MKQSTRQNFFADLSAGTFSLGIQKQFGVVYTPDRVVTMMLGKIPTYKDVSICDPSCGDGQFLVAIATQVCEKIARIRDEHTKKAYYSTLSKLVGLDVDKEALDECRRRLDDVIRKYDCEPVEWRLYEVNAIDKEALKQTQIESVDYVVGNPPYVRIQHLEKNRREQISKGGWQLIKGCSDLYILFFELGFDLLKKGGKLIYITPNSWMKSNSGKTLRDMIRQKHNLKSIIDFGDYQVFRGVTTYTAITEIDAWEPEDNQYQGWKCSSFSGDYPALTRSHITMNNSNWQIVTETELRFIMSITKRQIKLGDIADIHVGIQTLADDVFVFIKGELDIEGEVTRRINKASVMKNGQDKENRLVIYPYENGKLIPENILATKYPKAYEYLLKHKERLLQRDKGTFNASKWYGYGRDVSILSGFGEKILTSSMNPKPNFQKCPDAAALFYSGYCIKPQEEISFSALLDALNSADMDRYIRLMSRPFRNGWFSYAKSFIKDFPLSERVYG